MGYKREGENGRQPRPNALFIFGFYILKEGENGRQPRPNGLVVSAGKCAGPIPAKNCTSCRKSMRRQIFNDMVEEYFLHEVQFSAAIEAAHFPAVETGHWPAVSCHFHLLKKNHVGTSKSSP